MVILSPFGDEFENKSRISNTKDLAIHFSTNYEGKSKYLMISRLAFILYNKTVTTIQDFLCMIIVSFFF